MVAATKDSKTEYWVALQLRAKRPLRPYNELSSRDGRYPSQRDRISPKQGFGFETPLSEGSSGLAKLHLGTITYGG